MKRVESLDYARGIMAFLILVYHYRLMGGWSSIMLMNKFAIYGVTIFFILSGLSLSIAYRNYNFKDLKKIVYFFWKRIIRIGPLFWLILSLYLLYYYISGHSYPTIDTIISNYTLTFGFINPMPYYIMGGWSIGVELVLYVTFPIIFILLQKESAKIPCYLILFFLFIYTGFYFLDNIPSLGPQWLVYINPINHLFYFSIGILISNTKIIYKNYIYGLILLASIFLFIFYNVDTTINLSFGINKIILSFSAIMFVYGIYHFHFSLPKFIHYGLKKLGESSYGVYLFHPIILKFILLLVGTNIITYGKSIIYISSGIITILISYYVFTYYEKPIMKKLKISSFEKST